MINSWKSFVYAVDQMRQLQGKRDLIKRPELYCKLLSIEREVDELCRKKIAEWNGKEDLFANEGAAREHP